MKVVRTAEGCASVLDLTPDQFRLLVDALGEVGRPDNPVRPFGSEFERFLNRLTLDLSKGCELFDLDSSFPGRFRLRLVKSEPDRPL